jgi:hypothetical protein
MEYKMIRNRKLTLEQRIARLERAVAGNRTSRRRVNEDLDMSFGNKVKAAVEDILGDYYNVTVELKKGALFVYVEDDEAANGYEYGIAGDFRVDESPDGYIVSDTDSSYEKGYEEGTARDANGIAEIITDVIAGYVDDL